MTIVVCPLHELSAMTERHSPSHVVTLLAPGADLPPLAAIPDERRLALMFHDIIAPMPGFVVPSDESIARLLAFTAKWDTRTPIVVHCWAGVSRSPAAAYITACQHTAPGREREIANALRRASPRATPNALMVALADTALRRGGRMSEAIAAIGRGEDCVSGAAFELVWDKP